MAMGMKYIVSIFLLSACASIPPAPHQDKPTHIGYLVDGFSDGETVHYWCSLGGKVLFDCGTDAVECEKNCYKQQETK